MNGEPTRLPLAGITVLEIGRRLAVAACGSLLADAGATVLRVEDDSGEGPSAIAFQARKRGVSRDARSVALAWEKADVVVLSSDMPGFLLDGLSLGADQILCDVVAFEGSSPGGGWTDALLQAETGIADMTGRADGPPVVSDAPVVELQGGMYAAAGILAAWRHRAATGAGQSLRISLTDCGINTLSSFLPLVFGGKTPARAGNRHPMAVPWNSFRATDGWLLVCSATDEHWRRLCDLIGRPDLALGAFEKLADRIAACDEVDDIVGAWTAVRSVEDCIEALSGAGIAAGPIVDIAQLVGEPNLVHRRSIRTITDRAGREVRVPRPFLHFAEEEGPVSLDSAPDTESDLRALPPRSRPPLRSDRAAAPALAGIRVLEIGQYTTAPLAAKQLALLGAEVIKIEPPEGEASRTWPPHQDGQGFFFTMNNANKRSVALDLRSEAGKQAFADLVETADVVIENMKPGSLARLGFDGARLASLNPRLVYCSISGFGHDSAYPGRPAFDTVVQAMSGLMAVTRADGVPTKLGISVADISGGIAGLFSVLVGLQDRDRTGRGRPIDLSMQDVSVWLTGPAWTWPAAETGNIFACRDGWGVIDVERLSGSKDRELVAGLTKAEIRKMGAPGVAPVRTVSEIAADLRGDDDGPIAIVADERGLDWPLFRSPFAFSTLPLAPLAAIGPLGEAHIDMLLPPRNGLGLTEGGWREPARQP